VLVEEDPGVVNVLLLGGQVVERAQVQDGPGPSEGGPPFGGFLADRLAGEHGVQHDAGKPVIRRIRVVGRPCCDGGNRAEVQGVSLLGADSAAPVSRPDDEFGLSTSRRVRLNVHQRPGDRTVIPRRGRDERRRTGGATAEADRCRPLPLQPPDRRRYPPWRPGRPAVMRPRPRRARPTSRPHADPLPERESGTVSPVRVCQRPMRSMRSRTRPRWAGSSKRLVRSQGSALRS